MEKRPAPGFTPAWPTVIFRSASPAWVTPVNVKTRNNDPMSRGVKFIDPSSEW
jgi:hypothetical protein